MSIKADTRYRTLISLAGMYVRQFRFYDAYNVLKGINAGKLKDVNKVESMMKVCDDKLHDWEERRKSSIHLLEEAEAHYGSHLESGYFYFRVKDYERAEEAYLKAAEQAESQPEDRGVQGLVEAYYGLAHTCMALDEPDKTVAYLEKAIEKDPDNPLFYRDLGLIAYQNNDMGPAELFFSKAIELAPREAELYKQLAGMYISIGEKEKAFALYENALQVNGDNPQIQQDLAILYKDTIENTQGCEA
jgi:tetratricopeptide (TPR) repeat protein